MASRLSKLLFIWSITPILWLTLDKYVVYKLCFYRCLFGSITLGNWQVIGFCFLPLHHTLFPIIFLVFGNLSMYLFGSNMLIWPLLKESVFIDRLFLVTSKCPLAFPFVGCVCVFSSIFVFTPFLFWPLFFAKSCFDTSSEAQLQSAVKGDVIIVHLDPWLHSFGGVPVDPYLKCRQRTFVNDEAIITPLLKRSYK